ncbi:MAG: NmrA/HSCARG family protein [Planctomycetota bacterium]
MKQQNPIKALVIGATGKQGGAVARMLLERGHKVRAFTRREDSADAEGLRRLGAEVVHGDLDDRMSIERAATGCDAIFAMCTPYEGGPEAETRQGINCADAAKNVKCRHLVYSSVANADKRTGIPFFDSKYRIERYIRNLGVPYTIVAPAYFMENVFSPMVRPELEQGRLSLPLPGDLGLQQVSLRDLARFVALVLEERERFLGLRIDIASQELTGFEEARILSRLSGRTIEYNRTPIDELAKSHPDMAKMFGWFERMGYSVEIERLHREYPEVEWHTFDKWASAQDWTFLKKRAAA